MWYEDSNLVNVGSLEFGHNAIYDYEVFQDQTTGELLFCCHEEPEEPLYTQDILAEFERYQEPRYDEQMAENRKILANLGVVV